MKLRSVQQASRTSTGTQDFTITGFGTPTAWIVTITYGAMDGTIRSTASFGIGWDAGSSPQWVGFKCEDAQAGTALATAVGGGSGEARLLAPTTGDELRASVATTTDGVTLSYSIAPSTAVLVTVDLIQCDNAATGSGSNTVTSDSVSGLGFEPTCIITSNAEATASHWRGHLGFAAQTVAGTITQGSVSSRSHSPSPAIEIGQICDSAHFVSQLRTNGSLFRENNYTLTSFDSGGFSYSRDDGSDAVSFAYLALQDADVDFWVGWTATATSTGTQNVTTPGFRASSGWLISTWLQSLDTVVDTTDPVVIGFHTWTPEEQSSSVVAVEEASDPAQAASYTSTDGFDVLDNDGVVVGIAGTIDEHASGFSLALTAVDASARYFMALVFAPEEASYATDEQVDVADDAGILITWRFTSEDALEVADDAALVTTTVQEPMEAFGGPLDAGQARRAGAQRGESRRAGIQAGQGRKG